MPETKNNSNYLNDWLKDTEEYKAGKTFEYVMENYGFKKEEILRLAGNESTIGTSPKAIKAAQETCSSSNFYDEPKAESLIQAIEEYYKLDTNKTSVVVGNGMDSIIDHLFLLFCDDNSSIIDLPPTFIYYKFAAQRRGVELVEIPREIQGDKFTVNANSIIESIKENTKIIFLCTPNNPDGGVIELSEIEKITKAAQEKNIIVFVDHAYVDFTDRDKYEGISLVKKYDNLIIGYTFSKAFGMAGYRVGYALMDKDLQKKFLSLSTPFLNTKPSIAAAKAALLDTDHYNKIIENNKEERPKLKAELEKLGFKSFESEANFILFYSETKSSSEILEALMKKGIIIREIKGIQDGTTELACLRVTIGTAEENQRFIKALAEI